MKNQVNQSQKHSSCERVSSPHSALGRRALLCPCVEKEAPICGRNCWHFTTGDANGICRSCGKTGVLAPAEIALCPCGSNAQVNPVDEEESTVGFFIACTGRDCYLALGERYDGDCMPAHAFAARAEAVTAWNRLFAPLATHDAPERDAETQQVG